MFQKLLVPLDGTSQSAVALPLARTVAHATGAALRVLRVVPPKRGNADASDTAEAYTYLAQIVAERAPSGLRVETVVRQSEGPAAAIVQEVWAWPADLIVMATHGRRGLRRAIRGSVAEALLSESPVPLLVARPGGYQTKRIATLLVPTDGTLAGAVALTVAKPLARMTGARVVLLQAVGNLLQYAGTVAAGRAPVVLDPGWQDVALASARSYVEGHAEQLHRAGIEAEGRAVLGPVGATIVRIADDVGADVIVMSTRAPRGPARAVLGSTADEVLRTARRPVLLVRQS